MNSISEARVNHRPKKMSSHKKYLQNLFANNTLSDNNNNNNMRRTLTAGGFLASSFISVFFSNLDTVSRAPLGWRLVCSELTRDLGLALSFSSMDGTETVWKRD